MPSRLDRLLSVTGPPLGDPQPDVGGLPPELGAFLSRKNGFLAFESALHVLPSTPVPETVMSVQSWNREGLWRSSYAGMANGLYFFAEDIFGGQFAFSSNGVVSFDPETGDTEKLAPDLEGWADRLLDEYDILTGFPIAHQWQEIHGPLPLGHRLLPKRPFVLGGEFTVENLYVLDASQGMCFRGEIATQIRDLPDGATISLNIVD